MTPTVLARLRASHSDLPPAFRLDNAHVFADLIDAGLATGAPRIPCDILVEAGRIEAIAPPGAMPPDGRATFDLDGGLVLPRFVDIHTHIDKGHIWARSPNPDGSFTGARAAATADREANWSAGDVAARMDFSLACAFAHGTGALRTHIDSLGKQLAISWPVFDEMRRAWQGRIALQATALFPVELAIDDRDQFDRIVAMVARYGGNLGGVTFLGGAIGEKLDAALDIHLAAAAAHGLDVDFHVDESLAPDACSLERIAEAVLRNRFPGRVLCGHCCSLAVAEPADEARIIARVAEAELAIVSLPMINIYLQDRHNGRTPRLRAVAPLHELAGAGVRTFVSSDNTRDPYYAYGDLDMMEVMREATRILHLDHAERSWTALFGAAQADFMRLNDTGRLKAGAPADMVVTGARTIEEVLARPQSDRVVIVAGRVSDAAVPDYRTLDALRGAPTAGRLTD